MPINRLANGSGILPFPKLGGGGITPPAGGGRPPFTFGNALRFDGVDDYVSYTSAISITGAFTWQTWFKPDAYGDVIGSNMSNANVIMGFLVNATTIRVNTTAGNKNFTVPAYALSNWHHLVITRDGSNNLRVYLNGVESTTGAQVSANTVTIDSVSKYPTAGFEYDGVLDEHAVLDGTAATGAQVTSLYNSGNGEYFDDVMGGASLYWRLNGSGTDTTAVDESSNNNDGTLVNFTLPGAWEPH